MHIHLPKPIHGWKQFFNEVAIIVLGIAIALGAEEAIAHWNTERQAERSLDAIRDEVANNLGQVQARLATRDCLDRRLAEVSRFIEAPKDPRPTWVGRPQMWIFNTSSLQAATSYGSLTALDPETQMKIATIYAGLSGFSEFEKDEQYAWAELRSISEDHKLSEADLASLRQAVQRARLAAWALNINGEQAIAAGRALGVSPARITGSRSVCIPMNTPFDEAAKLSGGQFGEPR